MAHACNPGTGETKRKGTPGWIELSEWTQKESVITQAKPSCFPAGVTSQQGVTLDRVILNTIIRIHVCVCTQIYTNKYM